MRPRNESYQGVDHHAENETQKEHRQAQLESLIEVSPHQLPRAAHGPKARHRLQYHYRDSHRKPERKNDAGNDKHKNAEHHHNANEELRPQQGEHPHLRPGVGISRREPLAEVRGRDVVDQRRGAERHENQRKQAHADHPQADSISIDLWPHRRIRFWSTTGPEPAAATAESRRGDKRPTQSAKK